jgi:AcrR family transcriptional regulator
MSINDHSLLSESPLLKKTPDRILDAALALFNGQGVRNVSTNHISAALGISPGNLYYYYRNRAAIVRGLFDKYRARFDQVLRVPAQRAMTYEDKVGYLEGIFETMWRYRFLHRDMDQLLREDDALRQAYRAFAEDVVRAGRDVLKGLVDAGIMVASDEALDALIINIWVLATAWSGFLTAMALEAGAEAQFSASLLRRGIYQVICMEEPFLSDDVRARTQALKQAYLDGGDASPAALFAQLGNA